LKGGVNINADTGENIMRHTPKNEIRDNIKAMGPCTVEFLSAKVQEQCPGFDDFPVSKVSQMVHSLNELFVDEDGMIDLK